MMSFPFIPYEVVAFTAEKLAFSGFRGLLLSELWAVIQREFKQEHELNNFQKDIIWKWLFFECRDEQNHEDVKFYVTYDKDPITIESNYQSFLAKQDNPQELRVLPTEETQCYYLTGISNNKKFILTLGAFPYQLLQEIARHGEKGTWASDLPSATGQDKRSMTGRLNKLEEAGLIVKEHRFYEEKRIHSTWAAHYKFSNASKARKGDDDDNGLDHTPVKMRKFIMNALKEAHNNIRTFRDLKVELKMNRNSQAARLFGSVIENLCDNGYIERIDVQDQAHPARKLYALRFLKDLPSSSTEGGYDGWDLGLKMEAEPNSKFNDDDEGNEYVIATFNDIYPLTAQVYQTIKSSGSEGIIAKQIVTSISGDVKHRQITRLLENNTDYLFKDGGLEPLLNYIPEHANTAIVKQSESDGRLKYYRYYTIDNFKAKLTKAHKKKRPGRKTLNKSLVDLEKQFYVKMEKTPAGPLLAIPDFIKPAGDSSKEHESKNSGLTENTTVVKKDGERSKRRNDKAAANSNETCHKKRRLRQRETSKSERGASIELCDQNDDAMDVDDDEDDYKPEEETNSKSDRKESSVVKIEPGTEQDTKPTAIDSSDLVLRHNESQAPTTDLSNRVFTPQIKQKQRNTRLRKEEEKSKIDDADVKGALRREQFVQLITELGGATFTSAKLGRMLDQRIQVEKPTDIKTIARDINKLVHSGIIEVQVVPVHQSGREINRRLIILNDPKHRPTDEFIEQIKSKSKEPIKNTAERGEQMPRRLVETEYTLINTREALKRRTTRLSSLKSKDTSQRSRERARVKVKSEFDSVLDFSIDQNSPKDFAGTFEGQLGTFELGSTGVAKRGEAKKSSRTKGKRKVKAEHKRKQHKIKTEFDISDTTALFRAISICKAFNKSFINYDLVASFFKDCDAKSLKRTWVHVRKQVGGLDAVNKGVEEFERIVMKGIEELYITVQDLETIDLPFYLDLWATFDTSKIEILDKFPLYSTLEENMANYSKKHTVEIQSDLFDQIDSDSMKQKEEALANAPFFYSIPQQLTLDPLEPIKTTIKAVYRHPNRKQAKQVKEVLSQFDPADVEAAFKDLENEKEIVRVDDDTNQYKLTEKVYSGLTSKLGVTFFKHADLFRENIIEVMESQRGLLLSQGIEDGSVAEILNLVSTNGVSLSHIDSDYTFEGYESRSMDKDALNCDLIVFKGATNDPINQSVSKVRVPVGKPCSYVWVDIDGQIDGKLWTHIIVSLLYIIHYRPGIPATWLYDKVHNLLSVDEFEVVTKWLADSRCIEVGEYSGILSTPNWSSLFGYD
ncbi:TFC3 [Candida margitis]|uniref:TFC3 n=1 Tax=Candida margitis TaxID=1775924 RepID=UPI002225F6A8|nr:TFC3 [Candida margitis]KAI5962842.1 TFC3 [Candida margitis]